MIIENILWSGHSKQWHSFMSSEKFPNLGVFPVDDMYFVLDSEIQLKWRKHFKCFWGFSGYKS